MESFVNVDMKIILSRKKHITVVGIMLFLVLSCKSNENKQDNIHTHSEIKVSTVSNSQNDHVLKMKNIRTVVRHIKTNAKHLLQHQEVITYCQQKLEEELSNHGLLILTVLLNLRIQSWERFQKDGASNHFLTYIL